jgi:hypothetical protein
MWMFSYKFPVCWLVGGERQRALAPPCTVHLGVHKPAIEADGQIEPALVRPEMGDVGRQPLSGAVASKRQCTLGDLALERYLNFECHVRKSRNMLRQYRL